MPRKSKRKVQALDLEVKKSESFNQALSQRIKFGESYTSLILGIVVVVVASILVFSVIRNRGVSPTSPAKQDTSSESTVNQEEQQIQTSQQSSFYTVQEGESLWSISEKTYKSGYNWVDIAKANNLANPDIIEPGAKLTLPKVASKEPTAVQTQDVNMQQSGVDKGEVIEGTGKITGKIYTVQAGDILWDVAIRAYADGYKWVDIAKANNLANPDIIEIGQNLTIPR